MKKNIIVFIFVIVNFLNLNAQSWQWMKQGGSVSTDHVKKVCTDVNNNVYVIGDFGFTNPGGANMIFDNDTAFENGVNQLFIVKYTPNGTVAWVKSIGGFNPNAGPNSNYERPTDIFYDAFSNSVYMTGKIYGSANFGSTSLTGSGNMFLTKIDVNGNFVWSKLYGYFANEAFAFVTTDLNGNVFLAGYAYDSLYFDSFGIPEGNFWAKLDSDGDAIWAKTISVNAGTTRLFLSGSNIYTLFLTENDTAWIDTSLFISNTPYNCILAKFDSIGNVQWLSSYSSTASTFFYSVLDKDAADNFYVTGVFNSDITFGSTTLTNNNISDFYLAKYDVNGNFIWAKQGNATNGAAAGAIATTSDGNTYISGGFNGNLTFGSFNISSSSPNEIFIARYSNVGDCLGVLQLGTAVPPSTIAVDNSGNVIVAAKFNPPNYSLGGTTLSNFGADDVFVAKHDVISGIGEGRIANNQLIIYANPTAGKCNITIPDEFLNEKNLTLSIFNNGGKLIQQKALEMSNEKIKLNLEEEAKGIYNAILSNGIKNYSGKIVFE